MNIINQNEACGIQQDRISEAMKTLSEERNQLSDFEFSIRLSEVLYPNRAARISAADGRVVGE